MRGVIGTGAYTGDWGDIAKRVKDAARWKCVRCDDDHWYTPNSADAKKMGGTSAQNGDLDRQAHAATAMGSGSLNPMWVSQLQGFPADWLNVWS